MMNHIYIYSGREDTKHEHNGDIDGHEGGGSEWESYDLSRLRVYVGIHNSPHPPELLIRVLRGLVLGIIDNLLIF